MPRPTPRRALAAMLLAASALLPGCGEPPTPHEPAAGSGAEPAALKTPPPAPSAAIESTPGATAADHEPVGAAPGSAEPASGPKVGTTPVPRAADVAPEEALAHIDCAADVKDFGTVWAGVELEHEFRFRAAGETDLVIVNYRTTCGCTIAHLEVLDASGARTPYVKGTPLAPGTELALGVVFDTHNREGAQRKSVDVYANVEGGVREMSIVANVRARLSVEPRMIVLDEMSVLESRSGETTVSSVSGEPFRLLPPKVQLPEALRVALEPVDPGADGRARAWRVAVELAPGMPKGAHGYPIPLETDLELDPGTVDAEGRPIPYSVTFTISVRVHGLVSVDPQNVSFGMVQPDQLTARTIVVRSHDPGFELPEPEVEVVPHKEGASTAFAETLRVTQRPAEGGGWEIELLLEGLAPAVERSFYGKVLIRTGHPDEPLLEVVLSGLKVGG